MQVRADGVRRKSLRHRFSRDGPEKTAAAVSEIEEHAPFPGRSHPRLEFAGKPVDHLDLPVVVHMRVYIAGSHFVEELFPRGPASVREDLVVDDYWSVRQLAC